MDAPAGSLAAVAMSGGVDSSVTAALLLQAGCRVRGYFLALAQPDLDAQIVQVRGVAAALGVPLEILDLRDAFRSAVLEPFARGYLAGQTPNPCMVCNPAIKCGRLLDHVLARGCDFLATGHYARIQRMPGGRVLLLRGRDPKKDQSYFLSQLRGDQLARLRFPLGGYTKEEVRGLAAGFSIAGVHGAESQDVCFLDDGGVTGFLARQGIRGTGPGRVVTAAGLVLGQHGGIEGFTIGQRRGLGIPDATPWYVIGLDAGSNTVVAGKEPDLWQRSLRTDPVNWISGEAPALPRATLVRIRYRHREAEAQLANEADGGVRITFTKPQRAITPGQYAVFYEGEAVLGGGVIAGARRP